MLQAAGANELPSIPRAHLYLAMDRRLRPCFLRVYRVVTAPDDIAVDPVLDVRRPVGDVNEPLRVGFVLREQELGRAFIAEEPLSELWM